MIVTLGVDCQSNHHGDSHSVIRMAGNALFGIILRPARLTSRAIEQNIEEEEPPSPITLCEG